MEKEQKSTKKSPVFLLGIIGVVIILAGIGGIIVSQGVNFMTPILMQPGPTNTMIQPPQEVSNNLTQPGILGELKSFEIEGSNFKFTPNGFMVNQGDTVQITFKNTQGMHNFVIDGLNVQTRTLQAGESDSVTFIAEKKGTFEFYCSLGNHKAMGMVGTLVVN